MVKEKDLPPPPNTWSEARNHKYWLKWLAAMNVEYKTTWMRGTFERATVEDVDKLLHRILPLKWVFTYKFNKEGYLVRFKARMCVRGDL